MMETTPKTPKKLLAERHLDIGKFYFYSNVVVGEFAEGVHVTIENATQAIQWAQEICGKDQRFVYISNRLHSYSMDPVGARKVVSLFPNLIGFAVVSKNKYRRMFVSLEKIFIKKTISVFYNLEDAFSWADELLQKADKSNA